MRDRYKPEGYTSVAPYLMVDGAARTVDFLREVFGGKVLRRMDDPDGGRIRHVEVLIDDTVVMLADAMEGWPAVPSHVHIYCPDVDAAWRRALAAGGTPVQEPARKAGEDDRRGGVMDPGGTTWWMATEVGTGK